MKIIVCLDDKNGMMFNHRRQSRDRAVTDDVLTMAGNSRLFITPYSEKLFAERNGEYTVDENMLTEARAEDYCFVEDIELKPYIGRVEEIVIYRWNRHYPADLYFDISLAEQGFKLASVSEFEGYSHEKITKEIFRR